MESVQFSVSDLLTIAGMLGACLVSLVIVVKYVVRSEVRSIPGTLHKMIDDQMAPIERRVRYTEEDTKFIFGVLDGANLVDSDKRRSIERKRREESASHKDGLTIEDVRRGDRILPEMR